ncbi:alpha/beta hydrolase [Allostella vacuolata]|nr:alpha/beta hydrolase [Stella vacuolata]
MTRARPIALAITLAFTAAWPALADATSAWIEQAVASGPLHGTLARPAAESSGIGVLVLPGSGPVDRDGNLPGAASDNLKLLARELAARGIATLRIDKRGVGASRAGAVPEEELRFDTYAGDAVEWLTVLRAQSGIARVALIGHSEGALVATMAALRTDVTALVLLAGAGEPPPPIIARQLAAAGLPVPLQEASRRIADHLAAGELVPDVPAELAALYRPSVQPYLVSWFRLDPARELAKVAAPVLIVQGTTDLQIAAADAERLAAARPDAQLLLVDGMNHVLKDAPADRGANLAAYADPSRPLSAAVVPAITRFLKAR